MNYKNDLKISEENIYSLILKIICSDDIGKNMLNLNKCQT